MKKKLYNILFLLIAFIGSPYIYPDATITGIVSDAITGAPIQGAFVSAFRGYLVRYFDVTNSNGRYFLNNVNAFYNYTLVFSAPGYQTRFIGINPRNFQINTVDIRLFPNGGTIEGTVTNANTTLPIPGATVFVFKNNILIETTLTNGSGDYSVSDLSSGFYRLLVRASGFEGETQGAFVIVGLTSTVDFALEVTPGTIAGNITDSDTTLPIEGALVEVYDNNILMGFAETNVLGNYSIPDLAPGSYTVVASALNYRTEIEGAIVLAGLTTTVDFALDSTPGTIEGTIINASTGAPIPAATVFVFERFTLITTVLTDQDGHYSISGFAPGNYIVVASAPDFSTAISGATVLANATTTINLPLVPNPGTISRTVIDAGTTQPLSGVTVGVFDGPVFIASAVTDPNGNYEIPNIEPNTYTVVAAIQNYGIQATHATVQSNTTTVINFSLVANPGTISGTVTDAVTTDPIPDATVAIFQGRTFFTSVLTDVNGNYEISNLAPGNYIVVVIATGYQSAFSFEIVTANATTIADFALDLLPGSIEGTITDACMGNGIQGALILTIVDDAILGFDVSDMSGAYVVDNLAPADYVVIVGRPNFLSTSATATVVEDEITTLNFVLIPRALPVANVSKSFITNYYFTGSQVLPVITWTASPGLCVKGYNIFRDGRFLVFIPANDPLRYVDIRSCKRTSNYSVQTVNSFGQSSTMVQVG